MAMPIDAPRIYMLPIDAEFTNVIRLSACHPMFLIDHFSVRCKACDGVFRINPTGPDVGNGYYDHQSLAFRHRDRYNLHEEGCGIYLQINAPHRCNPHDPEAKTVKISYIEGWGRQLSDTNHLGVPILALRCCDTFLLEAAVLSPQFAWNIRTGSHQHFDVHPDFGDGRGWGGLHTVVAGVDDEGHEYGVAVHYYIQSGYDIRRRQDLPPPSPDIPQVEPGMSVGIRGFQPEWICEDPVMGTML